MNPSRASIAILMIVGPWTTLLHCSGHLEPFGAVVRVDAGHDSGEVVDARRMEPAPLHWNDGSDPPWDCTLNPCPPAYNPPPPGFPPHNHR